MAGRGAAYASIISARNADTGFIPCGESGRFANTAAGWTESGPMTVFAPRTESFVAELDSAIEAHLGWTRRVLRCAVLRTSPGEDVLALEAHLRCRFGRWFVRSRETFEQVDAGARPRPLDVGPGMRRQHIARSP